MFLVDTCGWIEWMIDLPLAKSYSRYLTSPDSLIVPTLVQHELHQTAIGHSSHRGEVAVQISRPSETMFTCNE